MFFKDSNFSFKRQVGLPFCKRLSAHQEGIKKGKNSAARGAYIIASQTALIQQLYYHRTVWESIEFASLAALFSPFFIPSGWADSLLEKRKPTVLRFISGYVGKTIDTYYNPIM